MEDSEGDQESLEVLHAGRADELLEKYDKVVKEKYVVSGSSVPASNIQG